MTSRLLPREDWDRLGGTECAALIGAPPGFPAQVLVIENDAGEIVACWSLIVRHEVEGLWVRPDCRRKVAAQRRLFRDMMSLARSQGILVLRTAATEDGIAKMIEAVGGSEYDRSLRHFVMPVVGGA